MNIILNDITPRLCQAIAHCEDLHSAPCKWKEELLHIDFITTEFQNREQDNRSKGWRKKCGLEEGVQVRRKESSGEKKKREFVLKEVCDKRILEGRYMKCGRNNHQARDCKAPSIAKTPLSLSKANQEPVQKKKKFDIGLLKIKELGSEEDAGNE